MSVLTGIKKRLSDVRRPDSRPQESIQHDDKSEFRYLVQPIGYVELKQPGLNEICDHVNKLYSEAKKHAKTLNKSVLTVSQEGILVEQFTDNGCEAAFYKHRRIRYCGVDKQHRRLFHFNYQYGSRPEHYHLHVILCKSREDAKAIAKHLSQIFKKISVEMHQKEREDIVRHTQLTKELHRTKTGLTSGTHDSSKSGDSPFSSQEGTGSFSLGDLSWGSDRMLSSDIRTA